MSEKLVRDGIPDIIRGNGEVPTTRVLNEGEYLLALDRKLEEEVAEYLESNDLVELGDVLEVVTAIAKARGSSFEDVVAIMHRKREERGGFEARTSLWMPS